jgi:hypothetical protein
VIEELSILRSGLPNVKAVESRKHGWRQISPVSSASFDVHERGFEGPLSGVNYSFPGREF